MLIRFLLVALAAQNSRAQNSFIGSTYEQLRSGSHCSQITREDAFRTKSGCQLAPPTAPEPIDAAMALENLTFSAAAADQIAKDKCVAAQARALAASDEQFTAWRKLLQQTWLRRRKVDLIINFCLQNFLLIEKPSPTTSPDALWEDWLRQDRALHANHPDPSLAPKDGKPVSAHDNQVAREKRMKPWANTCLNNNTLSALHAAHRLLPASLPLVSSQELFEDTDAHRDLVSSAVSGVGARDDEILAADLRGLTKFDFDPSPEFDQVLKQRLSKLASDRDTSAANMIKSQIDPGFYALDDTQKQYIYDDGTLNQALTEHFAGKSPARLSLAEGCMAARWQASQTGAALDSGTSLLVTGGFLGTALKGIRVAVTGTRMIQAARKVSAASKLGAVAFAGATLASDLGSLLDVVGTCVHEHGPLREPDPAHLPNRVGYQKLSLAAKPTPECLDPRVQRMMFNSVEKAVCTGDAIGSTLPALGAEFAGAPK